MTPQRAYRAACPNCGAPVEFASAASASAVCSFCRSTLVRDGDALRRIGAVAELFDDHSPLQRGASGRLQGVAFTLVGRLQYRYAEGTWNEWHALFDNGAGGTRSGWLSEDNGAYVFAFDAALAEAPPPFESLRAGQRLALGGQAWDVASVQRAGLLSAEGELPRPPRLQGEFGVADLRNAAGEVATLDYSSAPPGWSIGRTVTLAELAMSGLRESSEKTLSGRALACPNCGAALELRLASTQSVTCGQCRAVVDVSQGVGAELAHYVQNNSPPGGAEPQIALGRTGTLALGGPPLPWQVVGFLERCDVPEGGDDDETTFWREYLLWNREAGFAFLVDAGEGWSWVRPLTGSPGAARDSLRWEGVSYRRRERYAARVTWVQGEFYWRVQRDEQAQVDDYEGTGSGARKRLSREETAREVTWSGGETLDAATVGAAFGLPQAQATGFSRDASPVSSGLGVKTLVALIVVLVIVMLLVERCSSDGCDEVRATFGPQSNEYRQCQRNGSSGGGARGGSWGGWSSGGGGHK